MVFANAAAAWNARLPLGHRRRCVRRRPRKGEALAHNLRRNAIGRGTLTEGVVSMTHPRRFGLPAAMSKSPTPGRTDGRLGLAIGMVASAALVIGVLVYALYDGSTKSAAPRPSVGTKSERSEVAPPPSKNQLKENAPTMPPHGPK
jgi:hypothetical protein